MSKAMRVVDREIIERQVISAWKNKSLSDFKQEVENANFDGVLDEMMSKYNTLQAQIKELETARNELKSDIEISITQWNDEHAIEKDDNQYSYGHDYRGTYIWSNVNSYTTQDRATYDYTTYVPYGIEQDIRDELGLQTMGGDFNGKDLVQALIEKFVNV